MRWRSGSSAAVAAVANLPLLAQNSRAEPSDDAVATVVVAAAASLAASTQNERSTHAPRLGDDELAVAAGRQQALACRATINCPKTPTAAANRCQSRVRRAS